MSDQHRSRSTDPAPGATTVVTARSATLPVRWAESVTSAGLTWSGRAVMGLLRALESWSPDAGRSLLHDIPPQWRGRGPVVLVGGYAATDPVLAPMAGWLDHLGYDVVPFTAGSGVGCAERATDALGDRLREVAAEAGDAPVRLVGHSRGGLFARAAARRVRDEVEVAALVTLGTPFRMWGVRWPMLAYVTCVAVLGSLGLPGSMTLSCLRGRCCAACFDDVRAPWPRHIPFTSIGGRRDAAVPVSATTDADARSVELDLGHAGLLVAPTAFAAVAEALSVAMPTPASTDAGRTA